MLYADQTVKVLSAKPTTDAKFPRAEGAILRLWDKHKKKGSDYSVIVIKRYILCFLAVNLILIMIFVGIQVVKLILLRYNLLWQFSADYKNYADDFNAVKNYIAAEFPDVTDKDLYISDSSDKRVGLFDPETNSHLILPDDVAASLNSIYENAFPSKDSVLDSINIHGKRISFCIFIGEYALVYSPDSKPTWVNRPSDVSECKVKVRSLGNGWYHVTKYRG